MEHTSPNTLLDFQDTLHLFYPVYGRSSHYAISEFGFSEREVRLVENELGGQTLADVLKGFYLSKHEIAVLLLTLFVTDMFKFQKNPCLNVLAARKTKEFINDLNEKRLKIIQKNHYEVLGLAKNTPQEKIRKAYIELSKKFHPDNLFGIDLPAKMIEKVTEVFQLINESYAVLSDKKQREEYLAEEKRQERSEKKLEIDKILEAETAFQRGTILLKLNKYSEALSAYAIANQAVPEEAEYITCHAWALYKANPHNNSQSNQAEMQLKRSIAINPGIANTYLYLGTILKNKGELNEAKKQFKKAIRINPNCHESGRELRLMEMRGK